MWQYITLVVGCSRDVMSSIVVVRAALILNVRENSYSVCLQCVDSHSISCLCVCERVCHFYFFFVCLSP